MCRCEKIQLDKIQNGRCAAIIDANMRNIWKTVSDSLTFTIAVSGKDMFWKI